MGTQPSAQELRLAHWVSLIREANKSNLSKKAWCDQNDISPRKFYYWQKKVRDHLLTMPKIKKDEDLPAEEQPDIIISTGKVDKTVEPAVPSPIFCELPAPTHDTYEIPDLHEEDPPNVDTPRAKVEIQYGSYKIFLESFCDKELLSDVLSVIRDV